MWDPKRAPGERGAEETYNLSDALAVAVWLNVFVRQSKFVSMANIAQSVNVISPLMTTQDGLVKQSTWWPLLLFSKYMRGSLISIRLFCSTYEGETEPQWLRNTMETPWLDVSATTNLGMVSLVVVNLHPTKESSVTLNFLPIGEGMIKVYTVSASTWDATNTAEKEMVGMKESKWNGQGQYRFPSKSITMLRWKR